MVGSLNRSASPIISRSLRKSLNGANTPTRPSHLNNPKKFNFLTPANSPSEIGRRNYVGGEEKENENEKCQFLKEKLRSPSRGSKNFMAPTISAASKFTPSPRKKILVERNDPVRTSIALSDGKATFFSSLTSDSDRKLDFGTEEKNAEAVVAEQTRLVPEVPIVPKPLRKVTFKEEPVFNPLYLAESCVEKVAIDFRSEQNVSSSPHEPDSKVLEESLKVDVVEIDFDGIDSDESKLKDSYMGETHNLSLSEGLEQPETGDSCKRLVDVSSIEPLATESLPLSTSIDDEITQDSSVPKHKMKSRPCRSWRSVWLFLVLLGTLVLSATNFSTMHSLVTEDFKVEFSDWSGVAEIANVNFDDYIGKVRQWSANSISYMYNIVLPILEVDQMDTLRFMNSEFYEWSIVAETVKVNFDDFTGKVKQWSADSISYLSKILMPVLEVDKMGPLQFMNLTILENNCQINGFSYVKSKNKEDGILENGMELEEVEDEEGEDEMEEVNDQETEEVEEIGEVEDARKEVENGLELEEVKDEEGEDEMEEVEEIGEVEDVRKEVEGTYRSFDSTVHLVSTSEAPDTELKMDISEDDHISDESDHSQEENESGSSVASTKVANQDTKYLELHASEIEYDSSAAETEILVEEQKQPSTSVESRKIVANSEIFLDVGFIDESGQIAKVPDSSSGDSRIQAQMMIIGISLVLVGLGTVAVMIYLKQQSNKASICVETSPIFINKMTSLQQEEPPIKDVIGESCASEMSNSQWQSSSYQKKKNTNRESLVYSSEYSFSSPSYGSFTTYETIPVKHGDGDEEIMTPVRRSSRIRKTSHFSVTISSLFVFLL